MLIKHIAIENFRGIKNLDWHVDGRMICLLGPGDSTKTTVIDAIELALAPRWNVPFSDADFSATNFPPTFDNSRAASVSDSFCGSRRGVGALMKPP